MTPTLESLTTESTIAEALRMIHEAQAVVEAKTRDFFFRPDGIAKISEEGAFAWVADRTIDEYKVGFQAAELLRRFGHVMEPWLVARIGEQVAEETMHYRMLFSILPPSLKREVSNRMKTFPAFAAQDTRWQSLVGDSHTTDYISALFEISLVFEGFASAAIRAIVDLPYPVITKAYNVILRDEESHHDIGLEFVRRICNTPPLAHRLLRVAEDAKNRADCCKGYTW